VASLLIHPDGADGFRGVLDSATIRLRVNLLVDWAAHTRQDLAAARFAGRLGIGPCLGCDEYGIQSSMFLRLAEVLVDNAWSR
jgi:hypothetical protein